MAIGVICSMMNISTWLFKLNGNYGKLLGKYALRDDSSQPNEEEVFDELEYL